MAVIHRTTMTPGKMELLQGWLPGQPWYIGDGRNPELSKAGGFRLDDPQGEVGIEFMMVADGSGPRSVTYLIPVSYRGAPLDGAGEGLIGTSEHGVLGRRWVYDGTHDPVLVTQLLALVLGEAAAQAQSLTDTADPSVTSAFTLPATGLTPAAGRASRTDGPHGTDLLVRTGAAPGSPAADLTVRFNRVLSGGPDGAPVRTSDDLGHVTTDRLLPDGGTARAVLVSVRTAAAPARRRRNGTAV